MTLSQRVIVTGYCILTAAAFTADSAAQESSRAVIKTETHVVLVDAVVTNHKGEYVRELSQKDFKIYEDNHEQPITSFSSETDPANSQPRHLLLFFDNSTIDLPHQKYVREGAGKFVESTAGPKRIMAVVEFGPGVRITQNFTSDRDRLKQVVGGARLASDSMTGGHAAGDSILAVRSLVNNLAQLPGRKSLVIFTGGLYADDETMTQVIEACNKANVALYPGGDITDISVPGTATNAKGVSVASNGFDNQPLLYRLAEGTGGFVFNTKDLLAGLERIGKEQAAYYMIGYSPASVEEGNCHRLKVKIAQSGMTVRSRSSYCGAKPPNPLSGTPVEKDLENLILSSSAGTVKASMQAPFFYTADKTVRLDVVLELPTGVVKFEKRKGKFYGQLNLLGLLYGPDGRSAARFSDTIKFDFDDKKAMEAWQAKPAFHYEKDVDGVPGTYTLKLVVSASASSFAKIEIPISIEGYDGKKQSLSGLAFSTAMHKVSPTNPGLDTAVSDDNTPLIANGVQFIPSARTSFKRTETVVLYAELYEPSLAWAKPPKELVAAVRMRLLDAKTGQVKMDSGPMQQGQMHPGNPIVPLALTIPVDKLGPGEYTCELLGADMLGGQSRRSANFSVE